MQAAPKPPNIHILDSATFTLGIKRAYIIGEYAYRSATPLPD